MQTFTEAYDFLISIIGNVPFGIMATDMEGYITMVNEEALQNLDIQENTTKIIETNVLDQLTGIPELEERLSLCFEKGREVFQLDELHVGDKFLNIKGRPILNGMVITTIDVSETKKAQDAATNALLQGQEMERRRLAMEIHDGIGPQMSAILLNLDSVKPDMGNIPERAQKKVETIEELMQAVDKDLRNISHALMPSVLIDFGVVEALKNLSNKLNQSDKIKVDFYHSGMNNRLEQNIELHLYRISQELLKNALKYAEADEIHIQLVKHKNSVMLTVEDDGKGFDKKEIERLIETGIGLKNINTRVNSLGGTLNIDTQVGKGVISTIEIPVVNGTVSNDI